MPYYRDKAREIRTSRLIPAKLKIDMAEDSILREASEHLTGP